MTRQVRARRAPYPTLPMLAVVKPSGPYTASRFDAHYDTLATNLGEKLLPIISARPIGALVAMNMRAVVASLLEVAGWRRMLILETDMLPPFDALIKHALHTEPIVGSVYTLHEPPYHIIAMRDHGVGPTWMSKAEQAEIIDHPGLHAVDQVGLGCTSIAREVFEQWPKGLPIFRNSIQLAALDDPGTHGEVSHDYYFCLKARELGLPIYIDSTIVCDQLTLVPIGLREWRQHQGYAPSFDQGDEVDPVGDLAEVFM